MRLGLSLLLVLAAMASAKKLVYVEEVSRHGARAPGTIYDWVAEGQENWKVPMQLSDMGMRQHFLIGHEMRNRYMLKEKLVPETWNKDEFKFVSTDRHRTLESGESQLEGLFPPEVCHNQLSDW